MARSYVRSVLAPFVAGAPGCDQDAFLKAFDELRPWIRGRGREAGSL